jgi:hypothetical protein
MPDSHNLNGKEMTYYDLLYLIKKYQYKFLAGPAICLIIALGFIAFKSPVYTAVSMVKTGKNLIINPEDFSSHFEEIESLEHYDLNIIKIIIIPNTDLIEIKVKAKSSIEAKQIMQLLMKTIIASHEISLKRNNQAIDLNLKYLNEKINRVKNAKSNIELEKLVHEKQKIEDAIVSKKIFLTHQIGPIQVFKLSTASRSISLVVLAIFFGLLCSVVYFKIKNDLGNI